MSAPIMKKGFAPIVDENSKVLILGSFPSVKSREVANFYYGHKQNVFWQMLCGYFGEEIPQTNDEKIRFLKTHGIALWDVVDECAMYGSMDETLKKLAAENKVIFSDIRGLLRKYPNIRAILINGTQAYEFFKKRYADMLAFCKRMPSTSPTARWHYNKTNGQDVWWENLDAVFAVS